MIVPYLKTIVAVSLLSTTLITTALENNCKSDHTLPRMD